MIYNSIPDVAADRTIMQQVLTRTEKNMMKKSKGMAWCVADISMCGLPTGRQLRVVKYTKLYYELKSLGTKFKEL